MLRRRIIMQPKGGEVLGSNYILMSALFNQPQLSVDKGASFTPLLTSGAWYGASMSASGQYQLLAKSNDYIYSSSDYGATWTAVTSAGTHSWRGSYVSPTGQYQIVTLEDTNSPYMTTDYGATWNALIYAGASNALSASCSDNGVYITIPKYNGHLRVSSNSGASFYDKSTDGNSHLWVDCSMSASGQYQIVVAAYDYTYKRYTPIYTSNDYGATWTARSTEDQSWKGVCMSASGQYMYAVCPTKVFKSADYGVTWTEVYENTSYSMADINCTSDGATIYAIDVYGEIMASFDYGTTWQLINTTVANINKVAISDIL